MPRPPTLEQQRYLLLLEQLRDEGLSQDAIAEKTGIDQTMVSAILSGARNAGTQTVHRTMAKMRLHRDFFFDPSLKDPKYRDHDRPYDAVADVPARRYAAFDRVLAEYRPASELTDEDVRAIDSINFNEAAMDVDEELFEKLVRKRIERRRQLEDERTRRQPPTRRAGRVDLAKKSAK